MYALTVARAVADAAHDAAYQALYKRFKDSELCDPLFECVGDLLFGDFTYGLAAEICELIAKSDKPEPPAGRPRTSLPSTVIAASGCTVPESYVLAPARDKRIARLSLDKLGVRRSTPAG